jgi:hypothetical protein
MVNEDGVLRRTITKSKEMTRRYRNLKSQKFFTFFHYVLEYNTTCSEDNIGPRLQAYSFQNNCYYKSRRSLKTEIDSAPKCSALYFNTHGGKGPKIVQIQMSYITTRTL